ncbi:MAG: VOC family protein [Bryobacteraceae bacterium]
MMTIRPAVFAVALAALAQERPARLHHLHLNTTDPRAAIEFYTSRLEAERRSFAGADAVWAHRSWLLFTRVDAAPKSDITSAIWHMGWGGGPNMTETYRQQLDRGTKFQTPLTDISDQCDGKGGNGRFLFAYIDGPDHALTELNTTAAGNTRFGHVHLLSEDPIAAAEWYVRHIGLARRGAGEPSREVRTRCGRQTAPAVSLAADDVSLILYPVGNAKAAFPKAWTGRAGLESTAGHAIDHLAFRVDGLEETLVRLRAAGVKVTADPRPLGDGLRSAFVEGPDLIRIELVEGVAR